MTQTPEERIYEDLVNPVPPLVVNSVVPMPPAPPPSIGPDGPDDVGPRPIDIPPPMPPASLPTGDGEPLPWIHDPNPTYPHPPNLSGSTGKPGRPQNPVPLGREPMGQEASGDGAGNTGSNSLNQ